MNDRGKKEGRAWAVARRVAELPLAELPLAEQSLSQRAAVRNLSQKLSYSETECSRQSVVDRVL